jgi:hypothetical protein
MHEAVAAVDAFSGAAVAVAVAQSVENLWDEQQRGDDDEDDDFHASDPTQFGWILPPLQTSVDQ